MCVQEMEIEEREPNRDGGGRHDQSAKRFRREGGEDPRPDLLVHQ